MVAHCFDRAARLVQALANALRFLQFVLVDFGRVKIARQFAKFLCCVVLFALDLACHHVQAVDDAPCNALGVTLKPCVGEQFKRRSCHAASEKLGKAIIGKRGLRWLIKGGKLRHRDFFAKGCGKFGGSGDFGIMLLKIRHAHKSGHNASLQRERRWLIKRLVIGMRGAVFP